MPNRLKLDFKLVSNKERADFVTKYLQQPEFTTRPPSETELETIANYILWGKDPLTGLNVKQSGDVQLESRNKTWDAKPEESLDALTESPTFNENELHSIASYVPTKIKRETFSREETKLNAPPILLEKFHELWAQIDWLDLQINFYDLAHGRRKNPPRPELLSNFTPSQIAKAKSIAESLNQFIYLKKRHLIVELRREQFSLRDSYQTTITTRAIEQVPYTEEPLALECDIPIFPLGCAIDPPFEIAIASLIFKPFHQLHPSNFTQSQLKQISNFIWYKQSQRAEQHPFCFDFTNLEHIYNLFLNIEELENNENTLYDKMPQLFSTLFFYEKNTKMPEWYRSILYLKIKKYKNQEIANYINKKYDKNYTANYISTIFRQKILKTITETALTHKEIIHNLFFTENFKSCNTCGTIYLVNETNFVKKARSADGFSNRCKNCDKIDRQKKKDSIIYLKRED